MARSAALCASLAILFLTGSSARATSPFHIFFDTGSVRLDEYARAVIDNAAAAIVQHDARLEVIGAADRAGPSAYNLRLSRRRADAVKAALIRRGVKHRSIAVQGVGEDRPLVETADTTSERQNRYALIVLLAACNPPSGMAALPRASDCQRR